MNLSKTLFTAGLQCPKQLWWRAHEPGAPELTPSPDLQSRFDEGARAERLARDYVPGGVLIESRRFGDKLEATQAALGSGARVLYGAAFSADDLSAATDILERTDYGTRLIEVKASSQVKPEHIADVAFQAHVLRRAGLEPARLEVMHLNRDYAFPALDGLFVRADVSARVAEKLPEIPGLIEGERRALAGPLPQVSVGGHCFEPHECPFMSRCFPPLPRHHVVTLYRKRERAPELEARGYVTVHDLPDDFELDPIADRQRRAVKAGTLIVEPGLREALAGLEPPLAFLDFETVGPAIPVWDGCRPWEQVPVQFSCHVEDGRGGHAHFEWLADDAADPREAIAGRLIEACRDARTVLAFYARFETDCLQRMVPVLPKRLAEGINALLPRIVDLQPLVRDYVYHPDFGGSFGLKAVVPALVPELGYDDLEIGGGAQATHALSRLLFAPQGLATDEVERLREGLRRYCALDTWAMVRLLERLRELADT